MTEPPLEGQLEFIPDRWYAIASTDEVGRTPVRLERLGQHLALWRHADGSLACTADRCPHRGASLSQGRVVDGCIECPFHGFLFTSEGTCTHIPAQGDKPPKGFDVQAHIVCEAHGLIWLWTGAADAELPAVSWFSKLDGFSGAGSQLTSEWETHYTRAIENQLDFSHLSFVHRRTIGRVAGKRVDVQCEVDGDHIRVWDAVAGENSAFVEFIGPNVWINKVGPNYAFLAFVPINAERTRFYVRFYQRFVTVPGLAWVTGYLSRWLNGYILSEDQAVVERQLPLETGLFMAEKLHKSDAGIIAYRKWRHRQLHPPEAGAQQRTG